MKLSQVLNSLAVGILLGVVIGIVGGTLGVPRPVLMVLGFLAGMQAPRIVKALSSKPE